MRAALVVPAVCGLLACSAHEQPGPPGVRHPGTTAVFAKDSPEWVVDQFYAWSKFPDEQKYITGEFARRFGDMSPVGTALKPSARVSAPRPLMRTDSRAVYATTVSDSVRQIEWYTYLTRDHGTWKIDAVRTLVFKPLYYSLLDTLKRGWRFPDAPATLRKSMELTIASDSTIRSYFMKHRSDFDALVAAFKAHPTLKGVDLGNPASIRARRGKPLANDPEAPARKLLERVAVTTVFRDTKFPGCTFVRIGGMGKAHAGYLHASTGCIVPRMNPRNFIYVEKIRENWYAYKAL